MKIGVILAAGKGSRFETTDTNKTAVAFKGKPLIQYGIDLYKGYADETILVTGAYEETVKEVTNSEDVLYVTQEKRLGTGHATRVAVESIEALSLSPKFIFVGYGDHMMKYTKETLDGLERLVSNDSTVMSLVAAEYENPNELAWGRVVRNLEGTVDKVVEQKDASEEERKITELNAGLYCFDYAFLKEAVTKMTLSPVTQEYYLTEMVALAIDAGKIVSALNVPFKNVGIGINTREQLERAETIF